MSEVLIEYAYQYCPSCAQPNVKRGSVPFRCEACGFVNFFGPVAAVGGLIINRDNQLLLVQRARKPGKGKWGLPGGFVDRGETIENALQREIREETQLELESRELLMTYPNDYHYGGIIVSVIDLFFVCKVADGQPIKLEEKELTQFRWVASDSPLFDKMAFESNRIAIKKWIETSA